MNYLEKEGVQPEIREVLNASSICLKKTSDIEKLAENAELADVVVKINKILGAFKGE